MSLNKFRDSTVEKQWMNINCNDLRCDTFECDSFERKLNPLRFFATQDQTINNGGTIAVDFLESGIGSKTYISASDKIGDKYYFKGDADCLLNQTLPNGTEIFWITLKRAGGNVFQFQSAPGRFDFTTKYFSIEATLECVGVTGSDSTFTYYLKVIAGENAAGVANQIIKESTGSLPIYDVGRVTIPNNQTGDWGLTFSFPTTTSNTSAQTKSGTIMKYSVIE